MTKPRLRSYAFQLEARVQRSKIVDVAGEHDVPEAQRANGDVTVGNVLRASTRQKKAHEPGLFVVEGYDVDIWKAKERRDARLAGWRAPCLGDARRGNGDFGIASACLRDHDDNVAVTAIERDQGARIENEAGHAAPRSSFRARARSARVGGPPVWARLCERSTSKSASAAS